MPFIGAEYRHPDTVSTDLKAVRAACDTFEVALEELVSQCQAAGAYMPGLATRLRLYGDELADRFPDDTNGGTPARHTYTAPEIGTYVARARLED